MASQIIIAFTLSIFLISGVLSLVASGLQYKDPVIIKSVGLFLCLFLILYLFFHLRVKIKHFHHAKLNKKDKRHK